MPKGAVFVTALISERRHDWQKQAFIARVLTAGHFALYRCIANLRGKVQYNPHIVRTTAKFVAFLALILLFFLPLPQTVAPDWTITTSEASRKPLTGVTVREVWQQYSLEGFG